MWHPQDTRAQDTLSKDTQHALSHTKYTSEYIHSQTLTHTTHTHTHRPTHTQDTYKQDNTHTHTHKTHTTPIHNTPNPSLDPYPRAGEKRLTVDLGSSSIINLTKLHDLYICNGCVCPPVRVGDGYDARHLLTSYQMSRPL